MPGMGEKQKEKTLIPGPVWYVENLKLAQHCSKPAPAAIGNVPLSSLTPLKFSQNVRPKLKKTITSSNRCCAGIRNGNPSLVEISSDFPNVF